MQPPQLAIPPLPPLTKDMTAADLVSQLTQYFGVLSTRLGSWANDVRNSVRSFIVRPVDLVPAPDGATTTFTVPFTIADDTDGVPMALLLIDGAAVTWTANNPPAAGEWTLVEGANSAQAIIVGTAPTKTAYFLPMVSR